MTMSRTLPALLLLIVTDPPAAAAQPAPRPDAATIVTADEAIALDRARMRDFVAIDCPLGREGEEVIVCGRRPGFPRYRVPMANPDIGPRGRDRAAAAQLEAMAANSQRCSPVGRDNGCGGGIDIIGIGFAILRGVAQALANRD